VYIAVKKLRKSVNICLSYRKIKVYRFLWPTVYKQSGMSSSWLQLTSSTVSDADWWWCD